MLEELGSTKIQTLAWLQFSIVNDKDNPVGIVDKVFNSKMTEFYQGSIFDELIDEMFAHMKKQIENPSLPKSGFVLDKILYMDVDFHKLKATKGSSYIPLPDCLAKKKAIINPKNEKDEECFKWAYILACNHKKIGKDPQRINNIRPMTSITGVV